MIGVGSVFLGILALGAALVWLPEIVSAVGDFIKGVKHGISESRESTPPEVGVYEVYGGCFVLKNEKTGHFLVKRRANLGTLADFYDVKFNEVRGSSFTDYLTFSDRGCTGYKFATKESAIELAKQVEAELIELWKNEETLKEAKRLRDEERAKEAAFVPKKVWRV